MKTCNGDFPVAGFCFVGGMAPFYKNNNSGSMVMSAMSGGQSPFFRDRIRL